MTLRHFIGIALAVAWVTMLVVVPAHGAESTRAALAVLCPGHQALAPIVDAKARKHLLHPVHIVAVLKAESGCRMNAVGKAGEVCGMQVMGAARNGRTNAELRDPAVCIDTGARWLSLMVTWCGSLGGGLGAYNSGKCDRGRAYSRKVLGYVAKVWKVIEQRKEPQS